MGKGNNKKVFIAMSGGIDSSVAAALLKKQGYDVVGIFLRLWKERINADKRADLGGLKPAKAVARKLGIRLIIIDARKEFKRKVVDYFLKEYRAGRTPNPCVVCNQCIKFKFLFDKLTEFGADCVATGHYARLRREFPISNFQFPNKSQIPNPKKIVYKLFTAKDENKDQSYFLYTLKQKQLAKILFPLGNYTKEEVRKLAKKYKLLVLNQEESQNVCFIREKYPDLFLKRYLKLKPGNIVDTKGEIIGRHGGLPLYTIGQRRGIKIGGTGPYFVVDKNLRSNTLIVTNNPKDPRLYKKSILVKNVNWVIDKPVCNAKPARMTRVSVSGGRSTAGRPKCPLKVLVRTRYRNPLINAIIKLTHNRRPTTNNTVCKVEFDKPQRAVTAGQSAVFYGRKWEVLGGGTIEN